MSQETQRCDYCEKQCHVLNNIITGRRKFALVCFSCFQDYQKKKKNL